MPLTATQPSTVASEPSQRAELERILDPGISQPARRRHSARLLCRLMPLIKTAAAGALRRHSCPSTLLAEQPDLVQSFCLAFLACPKRFLANFDPEKGALQSFLRVVAYRFCRDLLKHRSSNITCATSLDDVPAVQEAENEAPYSADTFDGNGIVDGGARPPAVIDDLLDRLAADRDLLAARFGLPPYDHSQSFRQLASTFAEPRVSLHRRLERILEDLKSILHPRSLSKRSSDDS